MILQSNPTSNNRAPPSRFGNSRNDTRRPPPRNPGRGTPGRAPSRQDQPPIQQRLVNLHDISAHEYLANLHELESSNYENNDDNHADADEAEQADDIDEQVDMILAHLTKRETTPPSDLRRMMSSTMARPKASAIKAAATTPPTSNRRSNNNTSFQVKMHEIMYSISQHKSSKPQDYGGLIDRGANGIVAGADVRVISKSHRRVNIQGIDEHQIPDISIGTVGAVITTQHGPVIGIMNQAAIHGQGHTIVSCGQLEYHGVTIDDKSKHVGGTQCMRTIEGYLIPLNFFSGLAYVRMRPYTDQEWDTLPHVILSSDLEWDPSVLDHVMDDDENWFDALEDTPTFIGDDNFNEYGDYKHRHIAASTTTTKVNKHRVHTVHDHDDDSYASDNSDDDIPLLDDDQPFLDAVDYAVYYHHLRQSPMGNTRSYAHNGETLPLPPIHRQATVETHTHASEVNVSHDPPTLQYTAWATNTAHPPHPIERVYMDRGSTTTNHHLRPSRTHEKISVDTIYPDGEQYSAFPASTTPTSDETDAPDSVVNTGTDPTTHAPRIVTTKEPNYETMRPLFAWLPVSIIKETFARTTQMARMPMSETLRNFFRSPYPAMNIPRRNEPVATDTIYSDTPAVDDGACSAQIFFGTKTTVTDVYGMKTDKQFVNTLEDVIRERGAMDSLLSDSAIVEISRKVKAILRNLFIRCWQSEPYKQQQNPAERRFQTVKRITNNVLDRTGAPAFTWLLCLMYVCYLLNHSYNETVNGIPLTLATGQQADISPLLNFTFWQKVLYRKEEDSNGNFPSDSPEVEGHWVGIFENVGHRMTYKILTAHNHVIPRSAIRAANNSSAPNIRAAPLRGEDIKPIVKSIHDNLPKSRITQIGEQFEEQFEDAKEQVEEHNEGENAMGQDEPSNTPTGMPIFDPSDLVGRTFLRDSGNNDGQRFRVRIVEALREHRNNLAQEPEHIQFRVSVNENQYEELLSFQEIIDHISKDESQESTLIWKFKRITAHEGPLVSSHPNYKGSAWNVMIEWENGEITSEPLSVLSADDPVTCAIYARDNNLLELPGWKRFARLARRNQKMLRMVNQAKLRSYRRVPKYMYGYQVPNDYKEALRFDEQNKNTKWQDSTAAELAQIDEYETFTDKGHKDKTNAPDGYKKIRVHLIYAVKHDGRHKARLVADGHLTDVPLESVYSGVVSLRGIRLIIFLAELNGMETWAADVGNAYLEAKTSERVYIIAGPEFGEREGHIMVIFKALYGLRSSGKMWSQRFSDCLREMGFVPSKAEPQLWMRKNGDKWEYIGTYVDDLCASLRDPQATMDILTGKYGFKLKGVGPIVFHLGCDFWHEDDGTFCYAPKKYLEKMMDGYTRMFGEAPSSNNISSPLEKGDHPELDTSEFLDEEGQQKYQSIIGSMQWAISLGRFDLSVAIMTLSAYRASPRKGHLDRAKRIYSYLAKMRHATIRVRTNEPDYSGLPEQDNDWTYTAYGNVKEQIPHDLPEPLGNYVTLTHYFDANLYHDLLTGRSVTGVLHFLNQTPIDWYAKKQSTVETATYGSEFVAARTCIEQVMDLRTTLRYLGVPIRQKSYVFGDNKAMIDSAATPHAKLHKRHTALSWHRVREAIAAGVAVIYHVRSEANPADILSKHWGYSQVWDLLKPLLFWKGDTMDIIDPPEAVKESE